MSTALSQLVSSPSPATEPVTTPSAQESDDCGNSVPHTPDGQKQTFISRPQDTPSEFCGTSAGSAALHPDQSHILRDSAFRQVKEDMKANMDRVNPNQLLEYFFDGVTVPTSSSSSSASPVPAPSTSSIPLPVSPLNANSSAFAQVKDIMKSIFDDPTSDLSKALAQYKNSGATEETAYGNLVKLCNSVLTAMRQTQVEARLNKVLRPEDKDHRIQFIRHNNRSLSYGWTRTTNSQSGHELCPLKPDILIILENGAQQFKQEQVELWKQKQPTFNLYDPSLPPLEPVSHRLMFRDVLSCLELKWQKKKSDTQAESSSLMETSAISIPAKRKNDSHLDTGKRKEKKSSEVASPNDQAADKNFAQMGNYAREFLSRAPGIVHTIGFVVKYDKAYVCWFDRQNILISREIFILNEPHVLSALIIALSRFTLDDWGVTLLQGPDGVITMNTPLLMSHDYTETPRSSLDLTPSLSGNVKVDMNIQPFFHRPSLSGRGTLVLRGTFKHNDSTEGVQKVAIKFSHPEVSRKPEDHFIAMGIQLCAENVNKYLPRIFAAADPSPDLSTTNIRLRLGLEDAKHNGARRSYYIVSEVLQSIASLDSSVHFFTAWLNCVGAHRHMWQQKLEHGDISLSNLMYRNEEGSDICGVLNDWDLATARGTRNSEVFGGGGNRTGTITFASLEFVNPGMEPPRSRRYRHDLESFGWCLLYQCLNDKGDGKNQKLLKKWHDKDHSFDSRSSFLGQMATFKPRRGFESLYNAARKLMWVHVHEIAVLLVGETSAAKSSKDDPAPASFDLFLDARPSKAAISQSAESSEHKEELSDDQVWNIWYPHLASMLVQQK